MADKAQLKDALFDSLENVHAGMLSIMGSADYPQPMSLFLDRDATCLWFITGRDTEFFQSLKGTETAQFIVVDKSLHASLRGPIAEVHDAAKLEELWSPVVGAWFKGGKDDPNVALLRLSMEEAAIWDSTNSALMFGWEILKANMTDGQTPDVGQFDVVRLAA